MVAELVELMGVDARLVQVTEPAESSQVARDFRALALVVGRDREKANLALLGYAKAARRTGQLLAEIPREHVPGPGRGHTEKTSFGGRSRFLAAISDCQIGETTAAQWEALARIPEGAWAAWCVDVETGGRDAALADLLRTASSAGGPKPPPEPAPLDPEPSALLRFCQPDLPTATIVTLILRVAFPDARTALDATYGGGAFWDGTAHVQVTGVDLDPARAPDGPADFRALPYADGSFDVVVFDPPHLADAGAESIMRTRYGTYSDAELKSAIWEGCQEVWRVARLGVVVKVTDHVHGSQFVSESDWVKIAIPEPVYDVVHQTRTGALVDPKWEEQLSARNNGSTFLLFRKDGPLHTRRKARTRT